MRLSDHPLPAACLFDGDMAETAASSAPWLIEIADGDRLTRRLFTAGDSDNAFWDRRCFVVIRSDQPLQTVRSGLRKITQFHDEATGKWTFLRFWDPLYARYLLAHGSAEMQARLLQAGPMMMRGARSDEFLIWSPTQSTRDIRLRSPFRPWERDYHALKLARLDDFVARVMGWLRPAYGELPRQIDEHRFVLELTLHAREVLGLKTERVVSDYLAASWLLRMPAERRLDLRPLRHEIPQATMARIHDMAYDIFARVDDVQIS